MKEILLKKYQLDRMSQRGITKSDIKKVLEALDGVIEVPGLPYGRRRWMEVNGKTVEVAYVETDISFDVRSVWVKEKPNAYRI